MKVITTTDPGCRMMRPFKAMLLGILFGPVASHAQTWTTIWNEDFNGKTYESCYATGGDTYWANCSSPAAGPRNSLINGTWEVSNTTLGATQSPSNSAGGRFLMYWSDNSYNGGAAVPAADNAVFRKTLTGLTVGKKYRISYKIGGLLQLPATTILNPASIGLKLNGTTVIAATVTTVSWQAQTYTWTATATTMNLEWTNSGKAINGDDFGLDDLLVEVYSNPLPVTLIDFTTAPAANCTVQLQWNTAEERDFSYFEPERSADGNNYKTIATIPAKGSNSNYVFTDAEPLNCKTVYRLKMTDKDGSYRYSRSVMTNSPCASGGKIRVYPVPASNTIYIKGIPAGGNITICNLYGQVVASRAVINDPEHIDIGGLPGGVYLLKASAGSETWTERIVTE